MGLLHPRPGPHPVHTVHRIGAGVIGGFLIVFGIAGLVQRPAMLASEGLTVLGLTTNGLLSVLSLIVGTVLLGAALRGGPLASMVALAIGVGFLFSAIGNIFVLGTSMNMLGFSLANVIFSLAVGAILVMLGAYGRVSGVLPPDNPYVRDGDNGPSAAPAIDARPGARGALTEAVPSRSEPRPIGR